jgi:ankyrin repeat protein
VKYLVGEQQVDPLCQDEDDFTPFHFACDSGDIDVIQYLVNEIKVNRYDSLDSTINDRTKDGDTAVHRAAHLGHLPVVKFFLSNWNFDLNTPGQYGGSPLHRAAEGGHLDVVKYLVDVRKCNPANLDERKATPLHLASGEGHLEVVKYLIKDNKEQHCDPLCRDSYLDTPIHWAAREGRLNVIKYFKTRNCQQMNVRNKKYETPLDLASAKNHGDVVQYLQPSF